MATLRRHGISRINLDLIFGIGGQTLETWSRSLRRAMDRQGQAEAESEMIVGPTLMNELILMQLRLVEGLPIADFRRRTGTDPLILFEVPLARLVDLDLVRVSDTHIALTGRGQLVADSVMVELAAACNDAGQYRPLVPTV